MEHVDYAYTRGMDDAEVGERLRETRTGVLGLARGDEAYAVPLAHYYDGTSLYFRLGHDEESRLREFIEATGTACYLVYDAEPTDDPRGLDSWSIMARGEVVELDAAERAEFDTAEINRRFAPIRVFDEAIEEIEITIVEFAIEGVTGRITLTE